MEKAQIPLRFNKNDRHRLGYQCCFAVLLLAFFGGMLRCFLELRRPVRAWVWGRMQGRARLPTSLFVLVLLHVEALVPEEEDAEPHTGDARHQCRHKRDEPRKFESSSEPCCSGSCPSSGAVRPWDRQLWTVASAVP